MPRVKRGVTAHRRHKKVLKQAKGYYGARSRVYRVAIQAVTKAGQYAYRDRRVKKRNFRSLWITRINAQARAEGISYSQLIAGLKKPVSSWIVKCWLTWPSTIKLPSARSSNRPGPRWFKYEYQCRRRTCAPSASSTRLHESREGDRPLHFFRGKCYE